MEFTFEDPLPLCINQITDKLFISDENSAAAKKLLEEMKITHILVVGNYLKMRFPNDYKYLHLPIDDLPEQKLNPYFEQAFNFIEEGERVLVHCAAGVSRSASMVIAYLMMKNKWSYEIAHDLVKEKRLIINPNSSFVKQLIELEKILEKEKTEI